MFSANSLPKLTKTQGRICFFVIIVKQMIVNDPLLSNDFHLMSTKLYTLSPNLFFPSKKNNNNNNNMTPNWKSSIPKTKNIATQSIAMKFGFQLAYKFHVAIIRVFLLLVLSLFLISFFFFTIR